LYDGDEKGRLGASSAEKKLHTAFNTAVITLPYDKSPDDFDRNELKELLILYLESF
jgi:hypothetical protein